MSSCIVLGIRVTPHTFQRVKIYEISLEDNIEKLKHEASKKANLSTDLIELVYCGNILEDDATLKSYGVKSGAMVHVLKKKEKETTVPVKGMSDRDRQYLVCAFRTFMLDPRYRSALHRLTRPEVLENIIMATPGLSDDPIAMSILQDPELLFHLENEDTVRRVAELHPSLAEAANQLAAAVHEEAASGHTSHQGVSSGYSYSLDALSDEDEMESSQTNGEGSFRQQSFSAITAAQLATALASATGIIPSSSQPSSSTTAPSTLITPEMVSQAMQQVIASSTSETPGFSTNPSPTSNLEEIGRRLSRQVLQMRELGLTDNALNLQALRITGGDLQAAIDLIFSGTLPPNSD